MSSPVDELLMRRMSNRRARPAGVRPMSSAGMTLYNAAVPAKMEESALPLFRLSLRCR
jgi:hypothetical protein